MRQLFISFIACSIVVLCFGCTVEDEPYREYGTDCMPLTIQVEASSFADLSDSGEPLTRTPLESGLETVFNKGDAIGIFAVKNGAIAHAVDNMKLTYVKTTLTTGEWTPPSGTSLYWSEGISYIAYYPYKEGVTIDASQTPTEIVTALGAHEKLVPVTDQSDQDKYTACDLMTALGEIVAGGAGSTGKTLKLNLTHRYALLVMKPQARFKYTSPDDLLFTYRSQAISTLTVDVTAQDVMLNGVKACKMDDGSYRAIVQPTDAISRISGTYTTTDAATQTGVNVKYTGSEALFAAGNCYTLTVNSPLPNLEKVRDLSPGDFVFFENGKVEIYPGDGAFTGHTIPDYQKAVGMIVTCDSAKMTDPECNKNGWNHAYVMALQSLRNGVWGDSNINETIPDVTVFDPIEDNMNGYSETEAILAAHEDDLTKYSAFRLILEHRAKNIIPADTGKCSPWFMPSIGQWFDMLVNICGRSPRTFPLGSIGMEDHIYGTETKEKLNKQLAKVGSSLGELVNNRHIFQCSSEFDTDKSWILIWHFEYYGTTNPYFWDRIGIKGYNKMAESRVWPFFAF